MPSRTAAPSQASTMMPASYDKNTSVAGDGDYVIIVEDVTSPPFLNITLTPAFLHVKVNLKKRARSKMESRR
ncbi:Alsin [Desmophyllum pertusum]|uniref:Alsin n=1 Tax=Desmophyllum pertusum TaxID=174260 RepID=A0A9X0DAL2_9CNID|nr:Alsin [Desmophyllum pertusum]